jgi:hypothetical protein
VNDSGAALVGRHALPVGPGEMAAPGGSLLGQGLVDETDGKGAFADGRGNPLEGAMAHIASSEDPWHAGLQEVRQTSQGPARRWLSALTVNGKQYGIAHGRSSHPPHTLARNTGRIESAF